MFRLIVTAASRLTDAYIDPITLWKDISLSSSQVNDFIHAVVADAKLMQIYAEAMVDVLSAKVQAFQLAKIDRSDYGLPIVKIKSYQTSMIGDRL